MKYATIIILGIAGIALAVWAMMASGGPQTQSQDQLPAFSLPPQQGDMSTETTRMSSDDGLYIDPSGFSFTAPVGLKAVAVQEPGAETIMVGKVQIYVTPYDEKPSAFGAARIRRDLPTLAMRNVREFAVGDGRGVEFDDSAGHQIWFAASGQLFQVSCPADLAAPAEKIVASFTFQ